MPQARDASTPATRQRQPGAGQQGKRPTLRLTLVGMRSDWKGKPTDDVFGWQGGVSGQKPVPLCKPWGRGWSERWVMS